MKRQRRLQESSWDAFGNDEFQVRSWIFLGAALTLFVALFGCEKPLPEHGTPSEQLYVARCGSCHRPFDPASMTALMWHAQVTVMQAKIAQANQPPLTAQQQQAILAYLERNAGKQ
jgi:hypothetical protein